MNYHSNGNKFIIGCYTKESNYGAYLVEAELSVGKFQILSKSKIPNASFVSLSKDNSNVYFVNEHGNEDDTITAARFTSSNFEELNFEPSRGSAPCYVSVNSTTQHVFVANYTSGALTAVALNQDGSLSKNNQTFTYTGNGPDERQEASHMHSAVLSPDEQYLLAADLGTDHIYVYEYNAANVQNPLSQTDAVKLPPGTGPRHIVFSADAKFVYVIGEVNATINVFTWDTGKLVQIQAIDMMPADYVDMKSGADIHLSLDGRFLYASQRGNANEIIVFSVTKDTGMLTFSSRTKTQGKSPRNFAIDPTGKYLLVAHQESNDVRVFELNNETGALTDTGNVLNVTAPVFLKFI